MRNLAEKRVGVRPLRPPLDPRLRRVHFACFRHSQSRHRSGHASRPASVKLAGMAAAIVPVSNDVHSVMNC